MSHQPQVPPPRDVCFVIYLDPTGETCLFLEIPDGCANLARALGWQVLARDSDIPPPREIEPAQSNPFRKD